MFTQNISIYLFIYFGSTKLTENQLIYFFLCEFFYQLVKTGQYSKQGYTFMISDTCLLLLEIIAAALRNIFKSSISVTISLLKTYHKISQTELI